MRVAELSRMIHEVADKPSPGNAVAQPRTVERIDALLRPYYELTLEAFADLLAKVKPPRGPKPTPEQAAEKAREAATAKQAKAQAAAAAQHAKAQVAAAVKAEKARLAEVAKKATAAEKARLAAEKKAAQLAAFPPLTDDERRTADRAAARVQEMFDGFRTAIVPRQVVDEQLKTLKVLDKNVLLHVARVLNATAGITPKTSKPKILEKLDTHVTMIWRVSHNVRH